MKKQFFLIYTVLLSIAFVPILFLISNEYLSLSKNEEVIETIYNSELESIINSINIHSDDVVQNWASRVNSAMEFESSSFTGFLKLTPEIKEFLTIEKDQIKMHKTQKHNFDQEFEHANSVHKKKLIGYLENNYRKIEYIEIGSSHNFLGLYFIVKLQGKFKSCMIVLDKMEFIKNIISLKIQKISDRDFDIAIIKNNQIIYSNINDIELEYMKRSKFWLFPGYEIGIKQRNSSLSELIDNRAEQQRFVAISLSIFLIVISLFLFLNIRKQLNLAQLKSEFVSNVSHEIRTPLALIKMFAETLDSGRVKNEHKRDEYYSIILKETERLTRLINKILNFSSLEKKNRNFQFEECSINKIVEELLKNYEYQFQQKKIDVSVNLSEHHSYIKGDVESLTEAFINIVDNAIKYNNKEEKKLLIRSISEKNKVVLEIEDNGIGISKKEKRHIFDKFYRVTKGNLANNVKGSGIGLNIVKEIIQNHGGKIEVASSMGKGSCFKFIFPTNNKPNA